jgi:hypothetical protein
MANYSIAGQSQKALAAQPRILIFVHPGSRIADLGSNNSKTEEGGKNCCPNFFFFFCSYKFNKIENYLDQLHADAQLAGHHLGHL